MGGSLIQENLRSLRELEKGVYSEKEAWVARFALQALFAYLFFVVTGFVFLFVIFLFFVVVA